MEKCLHTILQVLSKPKNAGDCLQIVDKLVPYPAKLNKWSSQTPDICWRCWSNVGTLIHIWWNCPLLTTFLDKVRAIILQITETSLKLSTQYVVYCIYQIFHLTATKMCLLNAAKALILIFWWTTWIPTVWEWLDRVSEIYVMEKTLAQSSDRVERFHKTWSPWFIFRYSKTYEELKTSHSTAWGNYFTIFDLHESCYNCTITAYDIEAHESLSSNLPYLVK